MKVLILVFGIIAIKTASSAAVEAQVSKAVTDAAAAGTAAVTGAVEQGKGAAKQVTDTAMAAAADPMGTAQGLVGQATAALPMDMSKITGMMTPMTTMMRDIGVNAMDAGEVMISGSLDHANKGMKLMGEQMKTIPLFGSLAAPLMNVGVQLTGMPRGLTASGFNMGRQGFNGLFGLFGVPAGSTKNSLKPEYSEGGYQIPNLSSLTSLIPKVPGLPATNVPVAAAA